MWSSICYTDQRQEWQRNLMSHDHEVLYHRLFCPCMQNESPIQSLPLKSCFDTCPLPFSASMPLIQAPSEARHEELQCYFAVKEGNVVGFSYGKEKLPLDVRFSRCCERHMIKKMTRLFPCWQVTWSANRLLKNSHESRTSLNIDVIFFTRIRQRLTSLIQSIIIHSDIHCSLGVGFGEDW